MRRRRASPPAPTFELYQVGAGATATVTDVTSGPAAAAAQAVASTCTTGTVTTSVTGSDRAADRATTVCSYRVVIPTCNGLTPTRPAPRSTMSSNGTSGRDVIVALGGADTIDGKGDDDVICGGDGPDAIDGGASLDSIRGGNGTDTCISGETRTSSCSSRNGGPGSRAIHASAAPFHPSAPTGGSLYWA